MEYVFGTQDEIEVLRTKGDSHSDLSGYQQTVQEIGDEKITDNFRVVRKMDSKEDEAGRCYDWYEIDRHNRIIDRTAPVAAAAAQNAAHIDYLSMMSGIDLPDENDEEEG